MNEQMFSKSNIFWENLSFGPLLWRTKDQNAIEIVLKITNCGSKDCKEKILSNFLYQKTEFEKFAIFSNEFRIENYQICRTFLPFRINRIVNFRIKSNKLISNEFQFDSTPRSKKKIFQFYLLSKRYLY